MRLCTCGCRSDGENGFSLCHSHDIMTPCPDSKVCLVNVLPIQGAEQGYSFMCGYLTFVGVVFVMNAGSSFCIEQYALAMALADLLDDVANDIYMLGREQVCFVL